MIVFELDLQQMHVNIFNLFMAQIFIWKFFCKALQKSECLKPIYTWLQTTLPDTANF